MARTMQTARHVRRLRTTYQSRAASAQPLLPANEHLTIRLKDEKWNDKDPSRDEWHDEDDPPVVEWYDEDDPALDEWYDEDDDPSLDEWYGEEDDQPDDPSLVEQGEDNVDDSDGDVKKGEKAAAVVSEGERAVKENGHRDKELSRLSGSRRPHQQHQQRKRKHKQHQEHQAQLLLAPLAAQSPEALRQLTSLALRGRLKSFAGLCRRLRDTFSGASAATTASGAATGGSGGDGGAASGSSGSSGATMGSCGLKRLDLGGAAFRLRSVTSEELAAGHSALAALGLEELVLANELLPGVEANKTLRRLEAVGGGLEPGAAAASIRGLQVLQHFALTFVNETAEAEAVLCALPESVRSISLRKCGGNVDLTTASDGEGEELRFQRFDSANEVEKLARLISHARSRGASAPPSPPLRLLELPHKLIFGPQDTDLPHLWALLDRAARVVGCHTLELRGQGTAAVLPRLIKSAPAMVALEIPAVCEGGDRLQFDVEEGVRGGRWWGAKAAMGAAAEPSPAPTAAGIATAALELLACRAFLSRTDGGGGDGGYSSSQSSSSSSSSSSDDSSDEDQVAGAGVVGLRDDRAAGQGGGRVLLMRGPLVADLLSRGSTGKSPFRKMLRDISQAHAEVGGVRSFRLLPGGGVLLQCGAEAALLAGAAKKAFRDAADAQGGGSRGGGGGGGGGVDATVLPLKSLMSSASDAYGFCLREAVALLPMGPGLQFVAAVCAAVDDIWREWEQAKCARLSQPRGRGGGGIDPRAKRGRVEVAEGEEEEAEAERRSEMRRGRGGARSRRGL